MILVNNTYLHAEREKVLVRVNMQVSSEQLYLHAERKWL